MWMGVWLMTVLLMVVRVQFILICIELLIGRKKLFLIQPSQLVLVKRRRICILDTPLNTTQILSRHVYRLCGFILSKIQIVAFFIAIVLCISILTFKLVRVSVARFIDRLLYRIVPIVCGLLVVVG